MIPEPSLAWLERTSLADIADKVFSGVRLDAGDGCRLFRTDDHRAVAALADWSKRRRFGDKVYYVLNQHINYSNVCREVCHFCAFARRARRDPGAWEYSLEEVFQKAEAMVRSGADELHIVGGVHPDLPWDYYLAMLRGLKARHPSVALKAFTAVEVHFFAELTGKTYAQVLTELHEAGLDALPGGGAEIFAAEVRRRICPTKVDADGWLEVHRVAHGLGIPTNCTMLYGHIETVEDRVDHLLRLRALQDETHGFMAYIPLIFHPDNTAMENLPAPRREDHLLELAVGRLLLDNLPHIKAYWVMSGLEYARQGLHWGADDIDGTVVEEHIYHMAGAQTPDGMTEPQLRRIIEEEGLRPVRRNCVYTEAPPVATPQRT